MHLGPEAKDRLREANYRDLGDAWRFIQDLLTLYILVFVAAAILSWFRLRVRVTDSRRRNVCSQTDRTGASTTSLNRPAHALGRRFHATGGGSYSRDHSRLHLIRQFNDS